MLAERADALARGLSVACVPVLIPILRSLFFQFQDLR
jgi:hypothetical protein